MEKRIVITSGKGGVGKTTVTANLGLALSQKGKKTVLVEGDVGLNNLDVALRVEEKVMYDFSDVLNGKVSLQQSLVEINDKLFLLPSDGCYSEITADSFAETVKTLSLKNDYVLIDCPAGIDDGFYRAAIGANCAIIVTTPHITAVRDAYKAYKLLESFGVKECGLIINRVRAENCLFPDEIAKALKLPLWGVLPEDEYTNLYGLAYEDDKKSAVGYSFNLIADYVMGTDKKLYDYNAMHNGLFCKIKRLFGGI